MIALIQTICLYCLPPLIVVAFVISLFRYIMAYRANKRAPESYTKFQMQARLVWLVVTAVPFAVLLLLVAGFILLLSGAIAFM